MKAKFSHNQVRWFLLCGMICLPAVSGGAGTSWTSYKPSWRVGQTWEVEVQTMTQPPALARQTKQEFVPKKITYGYTFKVKATEEIEGEVCYQIRIQLMTINGNEVTATPKVKGAPREYSYFYRIFNRADDGSLKMIQRFNEHTGKMEASEKYPRGPAHATDWLSFLPAEFPVFSEEGQRRYGPPDTAEPNATDVRKGIRSWHWQRSQPAKDVWVVNGTEKSALSITLFRGRPGDMMGPERAEQIWIKGMPWPVYTHYTFGNNPPLSAKLVRADDSRITAMPQEKK